MKNGLLKCYECWRGYPSHHYKCFHSKIIKCYFTQLETSRHINKIRRLFIHDSSLICKFFRRLPLWTLPISLSRSLPSLSETWCYVQTVASSSLLPFTYPILLKIWRRQGPYKVDLVTVEDLSLSGQIPPDVEWPQPNGIMKTIHVGDRPSSVPFALEACLYYHQDLPVNVHDSQLV